MFDVISGALPLLLDGLKWTVIATGISIVFATVIGLATGLMRLSSNRILRGMVAAYVNIFRGTPLLIQILFIYFGIPSLVHITWSPLVAGIITLSLNVGAYVCEVFRGGVESIDRGQAEAGMAVGLTPAAVLRLIVLPQAARAMLPSFINQFILAVKDTSLLSVIGVTELTMRGEAVYAENFQAFDILFAMGVLYFIICYSLSFASRIVERKVVMS